MTRERLKDLYFDWRCSLIGRSYRGRSYNCLLTYLDTVPFQYVLALDANREADGIDFRYRFGLEQGYDQRMVATYLDDCPCSVLEMMVALAFRCEEQIMGNVEYGDRTGQWFWSMIESLGLLGMDDPYFDEPYVEEVIDIFQNRTYTRNGQGGLFTVSNPNHDMPRTEIWYQMHHYLNELQNTE